MKKIFFMILTLGLLYGASAFSASAQVVDRVEAVIPFDFSIRDTTFPAGEYSVIRVRRENDRTMVLQDAERKNVMVFLTGAARLNNDADRTMLIFDRIGDQYFLSKVFEEGDRVGIAVQKSQREKRLQREMSSVQSVVVYASR